jgi:hypothetical protein
MASDNSRKRKRVVEVSPVRSISTSEGDTVHVTRRRTSAGISRTAPTPLTEARTRGNQIRQARTARHANSMPIALSAPHTLRFES